MRFLVSLRRVWHLLSYGGEGRGGEGKEGGLTIVRW